ncbi:MAG: hypothetical protein HY534_06015 [Chloroflexi bacterium]|nr:hypothetical protein [Chloroflexota bacterium]
MMIANRRSDQDERRPPYGRLYVLAAPSVLKKKAWMRRLSYARRAEFARLFCTRSAVESLADQVAHALVTHYGRNSNPLRDMAYAAIADLVGFVESQFEVLDDVSPEPLWVTAKRLQADAVNDMAFQTVFVSTAEPEEGPPPDEMGTRYWDGVVYVHPTTLLVEDGFLDHFEKRKIWSALHVVRGRRSWLGDWPSLADPGGVAFGQVLADLGRSWLTSSSLDGHGAHNEGSETGE